MRKIPTLFVRDEATNRRHVRDEVTAGCEWVLEGEGLATRKFDGMCCLVRDGRLYKRREVKVELPDDDPDTGVLVIPDGLRADLDADPVARADYEATLARLVKTKAESRLMPGVAFVPDDFEVVAYDPETGKLFGWVPVGDGKDDARHREAFAADQAWGEPLKDGQTYELCGPKVNGNPEGFPTHVLVRHGVTVARDVPLSFEGLRDWMQATRYEGVVWHHPDGRMAKLKRKDFPKAVGA